MERHPDFSSCMIDYRPIVNSIIARHNRTIKALLVSEREGIVPLQAVFWYKIHVSPRNGKLETSISYKSPHLSRGIHLVEVSEDASEEQANVKVGDEVWVKPPSAKCT
ncbi:hypothetical protein ElyMa_005360200 [Elysia marginata]|uniref:Uncharacterized protein n=1 Tax=Elysia marginata TaxID=1093978 RepID=A0AAV4ECM9_9GAST|nr:hypothetical protein ElyMa_005360200 [Elysia marginata]